MRCPICGKEMTMVCDGNVGYCRECDIYEAVEGAPRFRSVDFANMRVA